MGAPRVSDANPDAPSDTPRSGACGECHAQLPAHARFCAFCAAPVGDPPSVGDETSALPSVAVPVQPSVTTPPSSAPVARVARRFSLVTAVAGVAVTVALVTTAVVSRDNRPTADPEAIVADAASKGATPWILARDATTMEAFRRTGEAVPASVAQVESELAEANRLRDADTRRAVRSFVEAELALLGALAPLAELDEARSEQWPAIGEAGRNALDRLRTAATALPKPARATAAGIIPAATQAVPHLERTLKDMSDRLAAWRTEIEKARAQRESGLAILETYAEPFRTQMKLYGELRSKAAGYVSGIADTRYRDDYAFFSEARAKRNEVREALSSYTPPTGLAAAHAQVNDAVDRSIGALDEAVSGLKRSEAGGEDYRATDGWTTFLSQSDEISAAWRDAVDAWDKAVAEERIRLNAIDDPPRPTI